jgi:Ni,Fe-hydrogenase I large subunit
MKKMCEGGIKEELKEEQSEEEEEEGDGKKKAPRYQLNKAKRGPNAIVKKKPTPLTKHGANDDGELHIEVLQEPLTEVPAAATATRSKARTQRQKKK